MQHNEPQLWVAVDTSMPTEKVEFRVFGTGNPIQEKIGKEYLSYIETYQLGEENLVFHLFEVYKED